MPQELKQTTVNTFVAGLITEASPLTFPDNASIDESNCTLEKSGVRKRRKGIELEDSFSLSSFTVNTGGLVHSETWSNVANQAGVEFLVVQIESTLYFYDKSQTPISSSLKSFSVDLNEHSAGNGENIAENKIDTTSIDGNLIVVSNAIDPFYVTYDPDTDTIDTDAISPKVRDFEWQGDTSEYFEPKLETSVSEERKYDTYNAGWIDEQRGGQGVLFNEAGAYVFETGDYPPLSLPWFAGKDSFGSFNIVNWNKIVGGTSLIGNGHYILDLFNKNRTQAVMDDLLTNKPVTLPTEIDRTRFTAVAKYAGRVWFAGMSSKKNGSKVFFSPVVEGTDDYGKFYQEADPTSEDFSDLIDSDGGVINIVGANSIRALFEMENSLLVFAENGVWEINGPDGIFKATEFLVSRVPGAGGLFNPDTLVDAEGVPIWWGVTGIFAGGKDEVSQRTVGRDISRDTIQTFFNNIGADFRSRAVGAYDAFTKQVLWLYGNDNTNDYKYNKVLIFDALLRAFVPWEFEDEDTDTDYVVGLTFFSGLGSTEQTFDVFSEGDDVVSSSGTDDVIVASFVQSTDGPTEVRFLVVDGSTNKLTFATITNNEFKDWGTTDFTSYADAGYDFEDDLTFRKNNVYITTYFNLTETGFTGDEISGYDFVNPSGCIMKAFWDLKNTPSVQQRVYRHLRPIVVDPSDLTSFNYPYDTIVTRNKIRGRGRVLRLRFESEPNKDFQLQGYEVINARNQGL